jgi:very-short-patch-repair endonuclease
MNASRSDHRVVRRRWPDRTVAALAGRQSTIVSNAQLRALGIERTMITRRLARGALHEVHRGVYSLVLESARPSLAAEHAALLACGPRAVLSHATAAQLHGLRPVASSSVKVDVTVIGADRRRPGIEIRRTGALHPADRHRVSGLQVTSVARTLIDLAPATHSELALERLLDQALKRTSATKIRDALARHPARPGTQRVAALLDPTRPSADTWSAAERRLLARIREAGLPAPEANVPLAGYVPDLLWRRHRVIVEFDSLTHHSGPAAFHGDRDRHNALTAQGYQVIHVTWRQLTERPLHVLIWIGAALARADG